MLFASLLLVSCIGNEGNESKFENNVEIIKTGNKDAKASTRDWDKYLDELEDRVDKCNKYAKKLDKGDSDVYEKYSEAMGELEPYLEDDVLEEADATMTQKQAARFEEIINRLDTELFSFSWKDLFKKK